MIRKDAFRLRQAALLLGLCLAICLGGCRPEGSSASLGEIESFIGAKLPAGARALRSADETGIDRLVRLRFDAPTAEARSFAAEIIADGLQPGNDPGLIAFGSDLDWWLDALPAGAEGGATDSANKTYKLVSVALDPATTRIWLAVFSR